jgi:hypothetical protein
MPQQDSQPKGGFSTADPFTGRRQIFAESPAANALYFSDRIVAKK